MSVFHTSARVNTSSYCWHLLTLVCCRVFTRPPITQLPLTWEQTSWAPETEHDSTMQDLICLDIQFKMAKKHKFVILWAIFFICSIQRFLLHFFSNSKVGTIRLTFPYPVETLTNSHFSCSKLYVSCVNLTCFYMWKCKKKTVSMWSSCISCHLKKCDVTCGVCGLFFCKGVRPHWLVFYQNKFLKISFFICFCYEFRLQDCTYV